jgi:hypothetical protein
MARSASESECSTHCAYCACSEGAGAAAGVPRYYGGTETGATAGEWPGLEGEVSLGYRSELN